MLATEMDAIGSPPIRHLVPLGNVNKWSDLLAVLIETDPITAAKALGLASLAGVLVSREDQQRKDSRNDVTLRVGGREVALLEVKVLRECDLAQLARYEENADAQTRLIFVYPGTLESAKPPGRWISVSWETLLAFFAKSSNEWVSATAQSWLDFIQQSMPILTKHTPWNKISEGHDLSVGLRARMTWLYQSISAGPVAARLSPSSGQDRWVLLLETDASRAGYSIYVEVEEHRNQRWKNRQSVPGESRALLAEDLLGTSIRVLLRQNDVGTSAGFDWDYLLRLWPLLESSGFNWVKNRAATKAADRPAWKAMTEKGGPVFLGVGFGDAHAKNYAECMFGVRMQLPATSSLGSVRESIEAICQLMVQLAVGPHTDTCGTVSTD